jgi:hypothetical protein
MKSWWKLRTRLQKTGIIIGFAVALGLMIWGIVAAVRSSQTTEVDLTNQGVAVPTPFTEFSFKAEAGKSPLALLRTRAVIQLVQVNGQIQVLSINGKANSDTAVWVVYVNDVLISEPPDTVILRADEQVSWRFKSL